MASFGPSIPKPSSKTFGTVDFSTAADGLSDAINLTGLTLSSIQMSTAWTDAKIGFKGSVDGTTNYYDMYGTDGVLLTYSTSANRMLTFDPAIWAGVSKVQLVSETSAGVAVAQAAVRTVKLGLSEYVTA